MGTWERLGNITSKVPCFSCRLLHSTLFHQTNMQHSSISCSSVQRTSHLCLVTERNTLTRFGIKYKKYLIPSLILRQNSYLAGQIPAQSGRVSTRVSRNSQRLNMNSIVLGTLITIATYVWNNAGYQCIRDAVIARIFQGCVIIIKPSACKCLYYVMAIVGKHLSRKC